MGRSNLIFSEEVKDKITTFIEYQKTFPLFMKYPQLLKRPSDKSYCILSHSWTQVSPFYIIINVSMCSECICLVFILVEIRPIEE